MVQPGPKESQILNLLLFKLCRYNYCISQWVEVTDTVRYTGKLNSIIIKIDEGI